MSCVMLSRKEKQALFGRLVHFMRANGGITRQELLSKLSHIKSPLTSQALSAYAGGRSSPNAETLIALRKVLGISIDFLLTGEEPPPPSLAELERIVHKSAEAERHPTRPIDPEIAEIVDYVQSTNGGERKLIIDLVRTLKQKGIKQPSDL